jgi:hypothetical protein
MPRPSLDKSYWIAELERNLVMLSIDSHSGLQDHWDWRIDVGLDELRSSIVDDNAVS